MTEPAEQIELTTDDGVRLVAEQYRPDGPVRSAVVIVHGFSGSRRQPEVVAQAHDLVAKGFAVVTYDGRGHGDSEGTCTLGDREVLDVAAAVEHARTFHDRVTAIGASMGAISALRYAADHSEIDGLVAVSSPSSWRMPLTPSGLLSTMLIRTSLGRVIARRHIGVTISPTFSNVDPPVELVKRITAPLAIIHGRRDRVIHWGAAEELHRAARGPRALHLVDRMGHAFEHIGRPVVTQAAEWALAPS